jgi:hypothetical protein
MSKVLMFCNHRDDFHCTQALIHIVEATAMCSEYTLPRLFETPQAILTAAFELLHS